MTAPRKAGVSWAAISVSKATLSMRTGFIGIDVGLFSGFLPYLVLSVQQSIKLDSPAPPSRTPYTTHPRHFPHPYNGLRPTPLSFPPGHKNPLPAMAEARILVKMENGLRVNYPRRQDSSQYREMSKIMQPGSQYLVGKVRFFGVPEESRPVSALRRTKNGPRSCRQKSFLKKMLFANDTSRPPRPLGSKP